jgi:hypothetical protein
VNTGTVVTLTAGCRSPAIGSGMTASAASHSKNCCSDRNWMLA